MNLVHLVHDMQQAIEPSEFCVLYLLHKSSDVKCQLTAECCKAHLIFSDCLKFDASAQCYLLLLDDARWTLEHMAMDPFVWTNDAGFPISSRMLESIPECSA